MGRLSSKVTNYTRSKGATTLMDAFDQQENCYNTLFDIRCEKKKSWGTTWYDRARYGYYDLAREELITKPACLAKTVELQAIDDLEWLKATMSEMEKEVK